MKQRIMSFIWILPEKADIQFAMNNREIKEQKISLNDAGSKGLKFLKDHKFNIWSFMIAHNMIMLEYLRM